MDICSGASTSHVNYNGISESLIDHIILPVEKVDLVIDCSILDDDSLNVSNHRPIVCTVKLPIIPVEFKSSGSINWRNVQSDSLDSYRQSFNVDNNINNLFQYDIASTDNIDTFHDAIVSSIRQITNTCIPKSKFKSFLKPYWNKELTDAHKCMKYKRRVWVSDGKPRGDIFKSYKDYKAAKCAFRKLHRVKVEQYLDGLNAEIDQAAEIDSAYF